MLLMYGKLYIFEAEKSSLGDARFAPLAQHLFGGAQPISS